MLEREPVAGATRCYLEIDGGTYHVAGLSEPRPLPEKNWFRGFKSFGARNIHRWTLLVEHAEPFFGVASRATAGPAKTVRPAASVRTKR